MRAAIRRLLLLPCLLAWHAAGAQALQLPPQPDARFAPALGTRLPPELVLRDEAGAPIRLGSLFGAAPLVLVPGYYTCPNLCGTLFQGVLQALALSGLPAASYRLVGFSIDPRDDAAAAAGKRAAYAALLPGGTADLRMLTGAAPALARLEGALGYRAVPDAVTGELAHAAGFVVADAQGRIAAFFPGVRFDPADVRDAVRAAHAGKVAPTQPGLVERIALLCTHYDPSAGRHSGAAMAAVRAGALLAALGLGGWLWARRRRHHRRERPS